MNTSSNTEPRTETENKISRKLPVEARAALQNKNIEFEKLFSAARDVPDYSPIQKLRFTENIFLNKINLPVGSTTIESTLISILILSSILPAITICRNIVFSGTEGI